MKFHLARDKSMMSMMSMIKNKKKNVMKKKS